MAAPVWACRAEWWWYRLRWYDCVCSLVYSIPLFVNLCCSVAIHCPLAFSSSLLPFVRVAAGRVCGRAWSWVRAVWGYNVFVYIDTSHTRYTLAYYTRWSPTASLSLSLRFCLASTSCLNDPHQSLHTLPLWLQYPHTDMWLRIILWYIQQQHYTNHNLHAYSRTTSTTLFMAKPALDISLPHSQPQHCYGTHTHFFDLACRIIHSSVLSMPSNCLQLTLYQPTSLRSASPAAPSARLQSSTLAALDRSHLLYRRSSGVDCSDGCVRSDWSSVAAVVKSWGAAASRTKIMHWTPRQYRSHIERNFSCPPFDQAQT